MKRLMPSSLITFLQANPNCTRADLFAITLPNGQVLHVTDGQFDITVPGATAGWPASSPLVNTTFLSTTYGRWARGPITSEASFNLAANSMDLKCVPQPGTTYPGLALGILAAAFNGLFDAATLAVYTCYMPSGGYGNVSAGIETKWVGFIEKIKKINRVVVEFECQDPFYLLNQQIPARLIQSGCGWGFCDANCALVAASYTVAFTAKAGSTQATLTPVTAFTQAAAYFSQGVITCLTGGNAGLRQTVKLHDATGNLQMTRSFLLPVAAGDTFSVIKGCDKSVTMCKGTILPGGSSVDNSLNFSGAIAVPQPSAAV